MKQLYLASILMAGLALLAPQSNAQGLSQTSGDRNEVGDFAPPAGANGFTRLPGSHQDFDRLDTRKRGYLTAEDVRSDIWLSRNFSRCNLGHDGHLTWPEFSACSD
ncbi:MAG: hypothetical protein ABSE43_12105 [Steroidobacteraceae bacterium]